MSGRMQELAEVRSANEHTEVKEYQPVLNEETGERLSARSLQEAWEAYWVSGVGRGVKAEAEKINAGFWRSLSQP
jgi:hypothetical protein